MDGGPAVARARPDALNVGVRSGGLGWGQRSVGEAQPNFDMFISSLLYSGRRLTLLDIAPEPVATGDRPLSRVTEQGDGGLRNVLNVGNTLGGMSLSETRSVPDVTDDALPILVLGVLSCLVEVRSDGAIHDGRVKCLQCPERMAYPTRHFTPRHERNDVNATPSPER